MDRRLERAGEPGGEQSAVRQWHNTWSVVEAVEVLAVIGIGVRVLEDDRL
jgi:hypothetical protein